MRKLENTKSEKKLIRLSDWNKYYDFPSKVQLRNCRQHFLEGRKNYVSFPFVTAFGRVYIDERKFFEWAHETGYIFKKPQ